MLRSNLLFYALILVLFSLAPVIGAIDYNLQNLISLSILFLLGIPHGSIDNMLFLEASKMSTLRFFVVYILIILLYAAAWMVMPFICLVLFLLISGYHFGQSQFSESAIPKRLSRYLYLTWGLGVIYSFIYFNVEELNGLIALHDDLKTLRPLFSENLSRYTWLTLNGLTLTMMLAFWIKGMLDLQKMASEIFILLIIVATAKLFSFLVGFTAFFVIVHAFNVMGHEFEYVKQKNADIGLGEFITQLIPLSFVSFIGISMLFAAVYFGWIAISYPLLVLIMISSITLPHAYVMETFYRK